MDFTPSRSSGRKEDGNETASTGSNALELEQCSRSFFTSSGSEIYRATSNISLTVPEGKFVSIVGPTGCGKSTVLNMAAGLLRPTTGVVRTFGTVVDGINPQAGYMFQKDAVLPWQTVRQNVAFGLEIQGRPKSEIRSHVDEWLQRVGLLPFADRFPDQLSGGQRRRIAMAQMWITDPSLILMDEPFSALDVQTRQMMEGELLGLWQGTDKAVVFITHDLDEAISLSDEVVLLSAGPASTILARFVIDLPRPRNLLDVKTDPGFTALYKEIWSQLRNEVLRAHKSAQLAT